MPQPEPEPEQELGEDAFLEKDSDLSQQQSSASSSHSASQAQASQVSQATEDLLVPRSPSEDPTWSEKKTQRSLACTPRSRLRVTAATEWTRTYYSNIMHGIIMFQSAGHDT